MAADGARRAGVAGAVPLYHFSEEPDIRAFVPRPPLERPEAEPLVWAIDEWHQPAYLLPRDCPRVCIWPLGTTTEADRERWLVPAGVRMVVAVEAAWLDRIARATLYRYTMPGAPFAPLEGDPWMHVARETVAPLAVEAIADLPRAIAEANVGLRALPELGPFARAVMQTTLHWSLIRMRNAGGWSAT